MGLYILVVTTLHNHTTSLSSSAWYLRDSINFFFYSNFPPLLLDVAYSVTKLITLLFHTHVGWFPPLTFAYVDFPAIFFTSSFLNSNPQPFVPWDPIAWSRRQWSLLMCFQQPKHIYTLDFTLLYYIYMVHVCMFYIACYQGHIFCLLIFHLLEAMLNILIDN